MTKIPIEDVLRVLRFAPLGLTTAEVAERLGSKMIAAGSRLSKLADYGKITRTFERAPDNGRRCRWISKDVIYVET